MHRALFLLIATLAGCSFPSPTRAPNGTLAGRDSATSSPVAESPPEPKAEWLAAAEEIDAATLAGPIRLLADDGFEGRGPGTRGDALTRAYLESEMLSLGLHPAADGAWQQPFELLGITSTAPPQWELARDGARLTLERGRDFVALSLQPRAQVAFTDAEVVFVGYGIEAPEYRWDDFKGVDVRGKVVLILNDDPDWDPELFAGKRRLYYGRWTYKVENAGRHGAVAVILLHTTESASYPWQTVQTSWSGENSRLPGDSGAEIAVQAWISEDAGHRLAAFAGQDLSRLIESARRRDFRPVPLGVRTSLAIDNRVRSYRSANVVGMLPGRDPQQARASVVYTAHHDHLGMRSDPDGQATIYNGAMDNAAGLAQMLAVARAFRALPAPPARSVLFVALAAEEQGLLGSQYFTRHPPAAAADMVAAINFDGGNLWGLTRDVAVTGFGKSTIDSWAAVAAARQGRVLVDERFPERGSFYRSDQLNFARAGVPVLYATSGIDFRGRPDGWGREREDEWIARHYHQPSDDFDPAWDLSGMVEDAQLAFEVGVALAESTARPRWLPGDEFERAAVGR